MKRRAITGKLVLPDHVLSGGAVVFTDGIIEYAGPADDVELPANRVDAGERLIAPGFVDIHCHGGGGVMGHEDPGAVAEFHRRHGTTSLLCTFYRNLSHDAIAEGLRKVAECKAPNLAGVHMEGPYLNPEYGSKMVPGETVDEHFYKPILETGLVRQWTYAPEMPGTSKFARDVAKAGTVPAIGHSAASPAKVAEAVCDGTRIVTHLMNATGCSVTPTRYAGTLEVSFDIAAMVFDELYFELILDKAGIHVRHEMVDFIIKAVGLDRLVGVTDHMPLSGGGAGDDSDVTIENGELCGSRLTMDSVARNFRALGLDTAEVFRVVSLNPARAINIDDSVGSLERGKRANILLVDELFKEVEIVE